MGKLTWKKLGNRQWESVSKDKKYDFVIDGRDGMNVLIVFNNKIKDKEKAFIENFELDSIDEAKKEAEEYK